MEYHLVIKPKLCIYNSKIIKPKFVNVIINWIDNVELKVPIYIRNENDPIYKFKLIYHGKPNEINNNNNNNSFNEDSFANLILIKTKGSNTKNFGGYNSHGFDHQNFKNISFHRLSDNFIFSFVDNEHIQNINISRIKPFSITEFIQNTTSNTFIINNQDLKVNCESYEKDLCTSTYKIEEIEAYSITKFI